MFYRKTDCLISECDFLNEFEEFASDEIRNADKPHIYELSEGIKQLLKDYIYELIKLLIEMCKEIIYPLCMTICKNWYLSNVAEKLYMIRFKL